MSLTEAYLVKPNQLRAYRQSDLTLVAVGASEAFLALAAELASSLAPAAAVRSAHIGRDVALSSWRAVGRHCDRAAVNHCGGKTV